MDFLLVAIVTLLGAGLTLFSGFGLGTLLMPVFALFFPVEIAIVMTAIVHFSNNLIKFGFFFRKVNWNIALRFGIPSIIAAFIGAELLTSLTQMAPWYTYSIETSVYVVTPVKVIIALLLIVFSLMELVPKLAGLQFPTKYMPLGGLLSGFFGGLSGNQGALRSAFLIRAGMEKKAYIATGVVIACLVDITRLSIYSQSIFQSITESNIVLLVVAVISAFVGVVVGNSLVNKITLHSLQIIVSSLLFLFALFLGSGMI